MSAAEPSRGAALDALRCHRTPINEGTVSAYLRGWRNGAEDPGGDRLAETVPQLDGAAALAFAQGRSDAIDCIEGDSQ